jgi:hypothetical protein
LVRTLPCHGRGRGFESRRPRHSLKSDHSLRKALKVGKVPEKNRRTPV